MAKFTVTFKDPDYSKDSDAPKDAQKLTDKFFEWDEYVTIEFDTVTKTARVVPVAEMGD
jgi:hypothetical protein